MKLPVPTSVLHDSAAIIDEHATAVAEGLTDVFIRAIWGPYQRGDLDSEQVVAMLARLRPLAVQGLVSAFGRAADRAARRGLDRPPDPFPRSRFGRMTRGEAATCGGCTARRAAAPASCTHTGLGSTFSTASMIGPSGGCAVGRRDRDVEVDRAVDRP